jgi:hypothetical protein
VEWINGGERRVGVECIEVVDEREGRDQRRGKIKYTSQIKIR